MTFAFDNSYARLPERFFRVMEPRPVAAPRLIALNRPLAARLGLDADALASADGIAALAGNRFPEGAAGIASAYAGHQFGQFVAQLGDGRAILLGEVVGTDGRRYDIQLKGAGRTPFSRGGDGRAALGPVLREYLVSEAMAALGVPTTRALAALSTGEQVVRETFLPGAVLVRVAASHIRVGTFQYFAVRSDTEALRALADHVIARHYPHAAAADNPYLALLEAVVAAQARLLPQWMLLGFIHGVMNTDNMSIAGETIDYGPCAFMDAYDPGTVFSAIDQMGRYAFANQPSIAIWNLSRFAETLVPLLAQEPAAAVALAERALAGFEPVFNATILAGMRRKLGLFTPDEGDAALFTALLRALQASQGDFTLSFRALGEMLQGVRHPLAGEAAFDAWAGDWQARLAREPEHDARRTEAMRQANPLFIPRNHRIEEAIVAATEREDFGPFHRLHEVLGRPFAEQPGRMEYANPPRPDERVLRTFCGT
jgi:uncharacterized protein YdiU (UPF0061 family)